MSGRGIVDGTIGNVTIAHGKPSVSIITPLHLFLILILVLALVLVLILIIRDLLVLVLSFALLLVNDALFLLYILIALAVLTYFAALNFIIRCGFSILPVMLLGVVRLVTARNRRLNCKS